MAKSVVAIFDEATNVDSVIRDLDRIGVPKRHVHALSRAEASEKEGHSWKDRVASFFGFTGEAREREIGAAYAEAMNAGDTLVIVDVDDAMADRAADVLNQYGAIDTEVRGQSRAERAIPAAPESGAFPISEQTIIPVIQEELAVGKRTVESGGVRVHSHVEEMPVEEVIRLREERVNVERHAVDRPVIGTEPFEEMTLEVTETAEQAVVAKGARVVEEVVINKTVEERDETIADTLRRQEVEVEPLPKTGTGGR
jgi:stress response protein YsnF